MHYGYNHSYKADTLSAREEIPLILWIRKLVTVLTKAHYFSVSRAKLTHCTLSQPNTLQLIKLNLTYISNLTCTFYEQANVLSELHMNIHV